MSRSPRWATCRTVLLLTTPAHEELFREHLKTVGSVRRIKRSRIIIPALVLLLLGS